MKIEIRNCPENAKEILVFWEVLALTKQLEELSDRGEFFQVQKGKMIDSAGHSKAVWLVITLRVRAGDL
ncbi:MAG: hypothetical protein ACRBBW_21290 [Cellvibrionaceae bacterium]